MQTWSLSRVPQAASNSLATWATQAVQSFAERRRHVRAARDARAEALRAEAVEQELQLLFGSAALGDSSAR